VLAQSPTLAKVVVKTLLAWGGVPVPEFDVFETLGFEAPSKVISKMSAYGVTG